MARVEASPPIRPVYFGYDNKLRQNPQSESLFSRNVGATKRFAIMNNADYGGTISSLDLQAGNVPSPDEREHFWFPFGTLSMEDALRLGAISEELAKFLQDESISPSKAQLLFREAPHLAPHLIAGGIANSLVESKAITHILLSPDAFHSDLWTPEVSAVATSLQDLTLPGRTGFTVEDLRKGTSWVLDQYDSVHARLKNVKGSGGEGQVTVTDTAASFDAGMNTILSHLARQKLSLADVGAAVELELQNPYALSVGQFYHKGTLLSFVGVIYDYTINGTTHFLGSNKFYYPGDWQDLLNHVALPQKVRELIQQVQLYESKLMEVTGILALRTNYNSLLGPVHAPRLVNPPEFSKFTEHTLRGGGSSLLDFLEWYLSQQYPQSASLASSHQVYSFEEEEVTLAPAHPSTSKLIYSYRRSPASNVSVQTSLKSAYAIEHIRGTSVLEKEETVHHVLFGDKNERIIFSPRKK